MRPFVFHEAPDANCEEKNKHDTNASKLAVGLPQAYLGGELCAIGGGSTMQERESSGRAERAVAIAPVVHGVDLAIGVGMKSHHAAQGRCMQRALRKQATIKIVKNMSGERVTAGTRVDTKGALDENIFA